MISILAEQPTAVSNRKPYLVVAPGNRDGERERERERESEKFYVNIDGTVIDIDDIVYI